ncbi:MAG: YraN family protein [Bacteroidales bacterium]|nr:YraN family protein [Bacteroidales bacterium]
MIKEQQRHSEHYELGMAGEEAAVQMLVDKGYTILERNYRKGHLEADIIALDGADLVLVEVKTRNVDYLQMPVDAVGHRKRHNMIKLANEYVKSHNRNENVRFDIITVLSDGATVDIDHIRNAFNVFTF